MTAVQKAPPQNAIKRDHYAEVTARIIASLENGVVPWRKPWGFVEPAQNHFSAHRYRGINALLTLLGDYHTPYFATIRQINEVGGRVKKGTKADTVFFNDRIYRDATGTKLSAEVATARLKANDKSVSVYPYLRMYSVFNMQDVEGVTVRPVSQHSNPGNLEIVQCSDFLNAVGIDSHLILDEMSDRVFYNRTTDKITVPTLSRFDTSDDFYHGLFHELTHWTGHASRLNRATLTETAKRGDVNYRREELTAELGACFLMNRFGLETPATIDNSAAYIDSWISALNADKRLIWDAAGDAQAAFTYLMERAGQ